MWAVDGVYAEDMLFDSILVVYVLRYPLASPRPHYPPRESSSIEFGLRSTKINTMRASAAWSWIRIHNRYSPGSHRVALPPAPSCACHRPTRSSHPYSSLPSDNKQSLMLCVPDRRVWHDVRGRQEHSRLVRDPTASGCGIAVEEFGSSREVCGGLRQAQLWQHNEERRRHATGMRELTASSGGIADKDGGGI